MNTYVIAFELFNPQNDRNKYAEFIDSFNSFGDNIPINKECFAIYTNKSPHDITSFLKDKFDYLIMSFVMPINSELPYNGFDNRPSDYKSKNPVVAWLSEHL